MIRMTYGFDFSYWGELELRVISVGEVPSEIRL